MILLQHDFEPENEHINIPLTLIAFHIDIAVHNFECNTFYVDKDFAFSYSFVLSVVLILLAAMVDETLARYACWISSQACWEMMI